MIIECINCNKKFEVNSDLIPSSGRTIQCGSCNYVWFFNPTNIISPNKVKTKTDKKIDNKISITTKKKSYPKKERKNNLLDIENKKTYEITKYNPNKSFSLSKFLSYILVLIISFIALIVIIDTFSTPLYQKFPNLELMVFSLFETLKDIELFIRDLI